MQSSWSQINIDERQRCIERELIFQLHTRASETEALATNILKHYWRHICLTRPRRFVTFYISALEILLLTYLLTQIRPEILLFNLPVRVSGRWVLYETMWSNWSYQLCMLAYLHNVNKKAELTQRWPRDASYIWVPWKFSWVPEYAHGYTLSEIFNGLLFGWTLWMYRPN